MMDEKCGDCKFFVRDDNTPSLGHCHRFPPEANGDASIPEDHIQCGEFK